MGVNMFFKKSKIVETGIVLGLFVFQGCTFKASLKSFVVDKSLSIEDVSPPSEVILKSPLVAESNDTNPVFEFTGLQKGSEVKIFADVICHNELGAALVNDEGIADVQVTQALAEGVNSIYSKIIYNNSESRCSDILFEYTVDTVAPQAPLISSRDSIAFKLSSAPKIVWSPSSDAVSGVSHYEIAIGSTSGGTDLMNWTNLGDVTEAQLTLSSPMTRGSVYHASLRAVDKVGNISTVTHKDWIMSDQLQDMCDTFCGDEIRATLSYNKKIYIAGDQVGAYPHVYEVNPVTGLHNELFTIDGSFLYDMALYNDKLIVGGGITDVNGSPRSNLIIWNLTTNQLDSFAPTFNGNIRGLRVHGDILYVSGAFTTVNGQARSGIAAFDLTNGSLTNFAPTLARTAGTAVVYRVKIYNNKIYFGGQFNSVNGITRNNLAALNLSDFSLDTGFDPNADNTVFTLEIVNDIIYFAGDFNNVGGTARNYLAAVTTAGALHTFNPNPNARVRAITSENGKLYVGGHFGNIASQTTIRMIASFNLSDHTLDNGFNARAANGVFHLSIHDNALYIGSNNYINSTLMEFAPVNLVTGAIFPE